jgi:Na+/H+ antiporter NhaD/arsenite permease-like protein
MMALIRYHPDELRAGLVTEEMVRVAFLLADPGLRAFLIAIALGSVFFGACTYIGNGPNFMVKSIADSAGAKTPSFVEYVIYYSLPILIPIYTVVWFIFIR